MSVAVDDDVMRSTCIYQKPEEERPDCNAEVELAIQENWADYEYLEARAHSFV